MYMYICLHIFLTDIQICSSRKKPSIYKLRLAIKNFFGVCIVFNLTPDSN